MREPYHKVVFYMKNYKSQINFEIISLIISIIYKLFCSNCKLSASESEILGKDFILLAVRSFATADCPMHGNRTETITIFSTF